MVWDAAAFPIRLDLQGGQQQGRKASLRTLLLQEGQSPITRAENLLTLLCVLFGPDVYACITRLLRYGLFRIRSDYHWS